jgi:hypothetical protein
MSLPNTSTYKNKNKKDYVAINIKDSSASYPPYSKLFCNLCSSNLVLLDAQKEEWYCNRCSVSYYPTKEKVRKANKFDTPGPTTDAHGNITGSKAPIFAMVDNTDITKLSPKKPNFPRSFEMLKRPGVNITDFSSTVDNEGI